MRGMNWFYSPDGTHRHEVDEDALVALAREGKLTGDMLLWRDGLTDWRPAREVRPDLFAGGATAGPPPPPPVAGPSVSLGGGTGSLRLPVGGASPGGGSFPPSPPIRPTDSAAVTSAISGGIALFSAVSSFCCCVTTFISPIAGLVAVIYGHQAYSKARGYPEAENDRNLALLGLILGYISLLVTLGYWLYLILVMGLAGIAAMAEGASQGSIKW